jgi:uncharacterized protein YukJ
MPSLISAEEYVSITGALSDLFDTVSGQIVVNKEPKKTLIAGSFNTPSLPGYSKRRDEQSFDYVPQSGIYPAMIDHGKAGQEFESDQGIHVRYPDGTILIKVKEDAKDFIFDGIKTENIIADGQFFNVEGTPRAKRCGDYVLWEIKLKQTE